MSHPKSYYLQYVEVLAVENRLEDVDGDHEHGVEVAFPQWFTVGHERDQEAQDVGTRLSFLLRLLK